MPYQKSDSFEERYGSKVYKKGFLQVPNILIQNLKKFGLEPVDLTIIEYIWSRGKDQYTAVSLIADATGKHSNTIRKSIRKLVKLKYLKRIYSRGDANKFDVTGLEKAVRVYTETGITPAHNAYTGIHKKVPKNKQLLATNKDINIKKIERLKLDAFPNRKNRI